MRPGFARVSETRRKPGPRGPGFLASWVQLCSGRLASWVVRRAPCRRVPDNPVRRREYSQRSGQAPQASGPGRVRITGGGRRRLVERRAGSIRRRARGVQLPTCDRH